MSSTTSLPAQPAAAEIPFPPPPDHTQLPSTDGAIVENFHEHPQSILLTDSVTPWLQQLRPDGQFVIGQDSGIYWRNTNPPLRGCKAPDWFYVPGVPPLLNGQVRRSYVLWHEILAPLIAIEFVSGDGSGVVDGDYLLVFVGDEDRLFATVNALLGALGVSRVGALRRTFSVADPPIPTVGRTRHGPRRKQYQS